MIRRQASHRQPKHSRLGSVMSLRGQRDLSPTRPDASLRVGQLVWSSVLATGAFFLIDSMPFNAAALVL